MQRVRIEILMRVYQHFCGFPLTSLICLCVRHILASFLLTRSLVEKPVNLLHYNVYLYDTLISYIYLWLSSIDNECKCQILLLYDYVLHVWSIFYDLKIVKELYWLFWSQSWKGWSTWKSGLSGLQNDHQLSQWWRALRVFEIDFKTVLSQTMLKNHKICTTLSVVCVFF